MHTYALAPLSHCVVLAHVSYAKRTTVNRQKRAHERARAPEWSRAAYEHELRCRCRCWCCRCCCLCHCRLLIAGFVCSVVFCVPQAADDESFVSAACTVYFVVHFFVVVFHVVRELWAANVAVSVCVCVRVSFCRFDQKLTFVCKATNTKTKTKWEIYK